jgi:hypothetical protein
LGIMDSKRAVGPVHRYPDSGIKWNRANKLALFHLPKKPDRSLSFYFPPTFLNHLNFRTVHVQVSSRSRWLHPGIPPANPGHLSFSRTPVIIGPGGTAIRQRASDKYLPILILIDNYIYRFALLTNENLIEKVNTPRPEIVIKNRKTIWPSGY